MGALSIAFDTIIVGALALPWALLIVHLFFSDKESNFFLDKKSNAIKLTQWASDLKQPALAGVLLFAIIYPVGSAVSRIAQDFFDDDDLYVPVYGHRLLMGVTESSIRAEVYCLKQDLIPQNLIDSLGEGDEPFSKKECRYTRSWLVSDTYKEQIKDQKERAEDIFRIQEGAILLKGTDDTEKLRQFHDQIMVLRGATFDALVAFSLCLFWWSASFRSRLRWAVPLIYFVPGAIALFNHLLGRPATDPPYMEFTLLILAAAGWCVQWKLGHNAGSADGGAVSTSGPGKFLARYLVLVFFLTATAFFGWWSTQVLYDEQVIYTYQALNLASK